MREMTEIMLLADILTAFGINDHGTYLFLSPDIAYKSVHLRPTASWSTWLILIKCKAGVPGWISRLTF